MRLGAYVDAERKNQLVRDAQQAQQALDLFALLHGLPTSSSKPAAARSRWDTDAENAYRGYIFWLKHSFSKVLIDDEAQHELFLLLEPSVTSHRLLGQSFMQLKVRTICPRAA